MKRWWNRKNHRFTLWYNINKHSEANNDIHRELDFLQYELTNENTKVGSLIKLIVSKYSIVVYEINHIQGVLPRGVILKLCHISYYLIY